MTSPRRKRIKWERWMKRWKRKYPEALSYSYAIRCSMPRAVIRRVEKLQQEQKNDCLLWLGRWERALNQWYMEILR